MSVIIINGPMPMPTNKRRRRSKLAMVRHCAKILNERDVPDERKNQIISRFKNINSQLKNKPRAEMTNEEERIMLIITPIMRDQVEFSDTPLHHDFISEA